MQYDNLTNSSCTRAGVTFYQCNLLFSCEKISHQHDLSRIQGQTNLTKLKPSQLFETVQFNDHIDIETNLSGHECEEDEESFL